MSWYDHDQWIRGYASEGNRECADFYFYHLCLYGLITTSQKEGRLRSMLKRDPEEIRRQSLPPAEAFEMYIARGSCPHSALFVCKTELEDLRKHGTQYTAATTVQHAITED